MSDKHPNVLRLITFSFGLLAVLAAIPSTYILGLFKEGYNPCYLTISELGEIGAPTALAATIIFSAIGFFEILFSAALAIRFKLRAAAFLGSLFMAINGLFDYIGSAIFPIDAGGLFESPSGQMHYLVSVIGMSVMVLPAFFYARALKNERMRKEAKASKIFAYAIAAAAALFISAFFSGKLVGLAQRTLDLAYFGWILYMAIALFRHRAESESDIGQIQ